MPGPRDDKRRYFAPSSQPVQPDEFLDDDPGDSEPMTFVLRLWREVGEAAGTAAGAVGLRGQMTHVESGERRGVGSVADVVEFLREVEGAGGEYGESWR